MRTPSHELSALEPGCPSRIVAGPCGDEGSASIKRVLRALPVRPARVLMVVLDQPQRSLAALLSMIAQNSGMPVLLAADTDVFEPGRGYLGQVEDFPAPTGVVSGSDDPVGRALRSMMDHAGGAAVVLVLSGRLDDGSLRIAALHETSEPEGRSMAGPNTSCLSKRPGGMRHALREPDIRQVIETIPQLVWRSRDRGDWDWVGPQWGAYTAQAAVASLGEGWLLAVHPDDRLPTMRAWEAAGILGILEIEHRLRRADGLYHWFQTRAACLPGDNAAAPERRWFGTSTDVDGVHRAEDRIQFLAYHDVLTGAANRALLEQVLQQTIDSATLGGGWCNLLFVDLDRFKAVNDRLGHRGGDDLLRLFAERLRTCLRDGDLLARTGGDEFVVLQRAGPPEEPTQLAERLRCALMQGFSVQGCALSVTASIGIAALVLGETGTAETLLLRADLAVYRAKGAGGDCVRLYEPWMEARLRTRQSLECDLRRAISNDELDVHYQPIIDITTGEIVGFEALARWLHPQRGLLQPETFIPLAEEARLIEAIGARVLDLACAAATGWDRRTVVAVNVSPSEIHDGDLLQTVSDVLQRTGLAPERLELDVTEALMNLDGDRARAILRRIRALGVRIALDDFGIGTSSLAALCRFPFDTVKIDRSLVGQMEEDPGCYALVKSVVALAESLSMHVTAEGVETAAQLAVLQSIGCRQAQGFLLGRPSADSNALMFIN